MRLVIIWLRLKHMDFETLPFRMKFEAKLECLDCRQKDMCSVNLLVNKKVATSTSEILALTDYLLTYICLFWHVLELSSHGAFYF